MRRRPKKTFRKRRFTRKRTFSRRKPLPRYDGMIRIKMEAFKEMANTDTLGKSNMLIDWGNQINNPVANIIRI